MNKEFDISSWIRPRLKKENKNRKSYSITSLPRNRNLLKSLMALLSDELSFYLPSHLRLKLPVQDLSRVVEIYSNVAGETFDPESNDIAVVAIK